MRARRSGFSESSNGLPESRQTKKGDVMFKSVKGNLPENSLFNINSVMFNLANNKEEIKNKFSCFYNPSLEALCVLIEEKFKYADLSKEIVMNLTDFAQKIGDHTKSLKVEMHNAMQHQMEEMFKGFIKAILIFAIIYYIIQKMITKKLSKTPGDLIYNR